MRDWAARLSDRLAAGESCVLVTVAVAKGSTPRESGAKMIVNRDGLAGGTIGGGHLELVAIDEARKTLAGEGEQGPILRDYSLGPSLGQCCGGFTSLLFEPVDAAACDWLDRVARYDGTETHSVVVTRLADGAKTVAVHDDSSLAALPDAVSDLARAALDGAAGAGLVDQDGDGERYLVDPQIPRGFHVVLFGAGHVGSALIAQLAALPCRVAWIDSREDFFPADLPSNVTTEYSELPAHEVDDAPPGSLFLVMTHSHAVDFQICERVLQRDDFEFLGLIGSNSKRERFCRDLAARSIPEAQIGRLVCPIGISGITGKHPAEIAVSTAAQLLQVAEAAAARVREEEAAEGETAFAAAQGAAEG